MDLHLICLPVTGVGLHMGYRGDVWFRHRLEVFRNYTLKSLMNQSNKDFLLWIWMRPEEEKNPITQEWVAALKESKLPFVVTFHGLMYADDKFCNYSLRVKVRNLLMMLRDCWAYKQWPGWKTLWRHTWENKNQTLPERLSKSLNILSQSIGDKHDWVYLTRIDSDDMFHRDAVDLIQSEAPDIRKALVFDKGYVFNT